MASLPAAAFGLVAPNDAREVARLEARGIDSFWVGGHLASPNPSPEPMVWLARLAEQTQRATIGTATLVLPWYQPPIAAKQLADIDRAADGRLIVGVGAGGEYADDFAAAGVPIAERGARLDESMDCLRAFWTGEPVDHDGAHFRYQALRVHPPPQQPGGPPIVVTGRREVAMRRAANRGDGWMPYLYSPERYARSVAVIEETAAARGRDLAEFRWMAFAMVAIDDDAQTARRAAADFLGGTYRQDFEALVDRVAVAGSVADVVAKLAAFVEAGARHFVLLPCVSTAPATLDRLLTEVIPEMRTRTSVEASR